MAFQFQTFRTRALTAIVFVIVMLTGLLWNQWSFLILFSIIHFGCWFEYMQLVGLIDEDYVQIHPLHRYSIPLAGFGLILWMTNTTYQINGVQLKGIGWWFFACCFLLFILSDLISKRKINPRLWAHSILGLIYISLSWGLMMRLWTNMDQSVFKGANWILPVVLIASIWINDTMAYLVGSFFGKTPLSPISPKKTWEGTIGGAFLAVIVVVSAGYMIWQFPIKALLLISITASITGTLGDLFESKMKRLANVKDSGSFMPGHGGFLDRFDSLLFSTTAVWIILYLFN